MLNEANKPTNPELWSKAKALAKKKFDVYPSAYANGWASKWYKGKGGGWKSSGETNESVISERKMTRTEKIKEKHLHKKMKSAKASFEKKYPGRGEEVFYATTKKKAMKEAFAKAKELIKEEVVNAKHKGTMTPKERKERDRIAKGLKGIKSIKGKPDSEKEAKYRYATYLVLKKRGGEKSEKTSKSEKPNKSTKKKKKSK